MQKPGVQKVNWRKWRSLGLILPSCTLMVLSHQNCAPAPMAGNTLSSVTEAGDFSRVTVINEIKSGSVVSFAHKAIEITPQTESVVLDGVCPAGQEDAVLGWKLSDSQSKAEFARGYARCQNSVFTVELTPTQELICGREYKLAARLGLSEGAEVIVSRICPQGQSSTVAAAN